MAPTIAPQMEPPQRRRGERLQGKSEEDQRRILEERRVATLARKKAYREANSAAIADKNRAYYAANKTEIEKNKYRVAHALNPTMRVVRKAAEKHGVAVEPTVPLVIPAERVLGPRPVAVETPAPLPPLAPGELDTTYDGFVRWQAAQKGKNFAPKTKHDREVHLKHLLNLVLAKMGRPDTADTVKDITTVLNKPDTVVDVIRSMPGERGGVLKATSRNAYFRLITFLSSHYPPIFDKLIPNLNEKYQLAKNAHATKISAETQARRDVQVTDSLSQMINYVDSRFGQNSPEYLYMKLYEAIPGLRNDLGRVKILDNDNSERPTNAEGKPLNFIIKQSASNGGNPVFGLRDYKTKDIYGARNYTLTGNVKELLLAKINDGRGYLFTLKTNKQKPMGNAGKFLGALLKDAGIKDVANTNNGAINALRHAWATEHKNEPDAFIKMLHTEKVHHDTYIDKENTKKDKTGDSSVPLPRNHAVVPLNAGDSVAKVGAHKGDVMPRAKPTRSGPPKQYVAEDDEDGEEVQQRVAAVQKLAKRAIDAVKAFKRTGDHRKLDRVTEIVNNALGRGKRVKKPSSKIQGA